MLVRRSHLTTLILATATAGLLLAAPSVSAADRQSQSIEFSGPMDMSVGQFSDLTATASSGLAVSFSASGSCRITTVEDQTAVVATGAGLCTVTASQPGDSDWDPAPDVASTFTYLKSGSKTAVYADGGWVHAPGTPVTVVVVVTGTEGDDPAPGGTVEVNVLGDVPPDLRELGTVTLDGEGHGEIVISAADTKRLGKGHFGLGGQYNGSDSFDKSYAEFNPLELFAETTVTATAKPTSGLKHGDDVTFTAHVAPVAKGGETPTGQVEVLWGPFEGDDADLDACGNATLTTSELPGGSIQVLVQYLPDNQEYGTSWTTLRFTIAPEDQSITFPPMDDMRVNKLVKPDAFSSSGLPVSYVTTTPKICDVDWDERYRFFVTALRAGTCAVQAEQTGDNSYNEARPVTRSFTVLATPAPRPLGGGGGAPIADAGPLAGPIGGVALASNATAASGRLVVVRRPMTLTYAKAPMASTRLGDTVRVSARGLPAGSLNLVRIHMGRSWLTLGRVTADSAGQVTLPVITVKKVGTYAVRVVPVGKAPRYLSLHVLPAPRS